jgi:aminomethyltransferase
MGGHALELKTPLYQIHLQLGGKMAPFGGYLLPVQYEGVIAEHMAVREKAGLFDVSHMGEIIYEGRDALANLNHVLTKDFTKMEVGQARYSLMCNEAGGTMDDLVVYKLGDENYMLVINAVNRFKDVEWMKSHSFGEVNIEDISGRMAQIALQGPASAGIITKLVPAGALPSKYYTCAQHVDIGGAACIVSRTGYTGEFGYELYLPAEDAVKVWNLLFAAGEPEGLKPCGLGARDTLRLEAGMPLYGHEMDETITPLESALDFALRFDKPDFIGKAVLTEIGLPPVRRVGLKLTGKGIAREHQDVYDDDGDLLIGRTTSGTYCPYLNGAYAMAIIDTKYIRPQTAVQVDVRGRRVTAEVVELPFYKRQ